MSLMQRQQLRDGIRASFDHSFGKNHKSGSMETMLPLLSTLARLPIDGEARAPILLPALLILFCAELLFLTVGDGADMARIHPCGYQ